MRELSRLFLQWAKVLWKFSQVEVLHNFISEMSENSAQVKVLWKSSAWVKVLHKWKFCESSAWVKVLHKWKLCANKVLHQWKFCMREMSESSAWVEMSESSAWMFRESSAPVKVQHEWNEGKLYMSEISMKVLHQWKYCMSEMSESSAWMFCESYAPVTVLHEWNEGKLYVSESSMKVLHQWKYCMCQMSESSAWVKWLKALHEWKEWKFCMSERSDSSAWVKVVCSQYCMATCMCTSESFQFLVSRGVCKNPFKDHSRKTPILCSFWNIFLHISCT